jgi:hypothetical protein
MKVFDHLRPAEMAEIAMNGCKLYVAVLNCSSYLQLLSSWWENVPLSAVVLDERQHGVALRSLAETPTGPMMMRQW